MRKVNIIHVVDSLALGGAERVAVDLVNHLPDSEFETHLCTTRAEGALGEEVRSNIVRLALNRRHRFDLSAVFHLRGYLARNQIEIVHAHSTSLFLCVVASLGQSRVKLVWHDHYGKHETHQRPSWVYGPFARRAAKVIAVSEELARWHRSVLKIGFDRVVYLPNFVRRFENPNNNCGLPGTAGNRIVCVANFRPQKDHQTLLRAMAIVVKQHPRVQLILCGGGNQGYLAGLRDLAASLGLSHNVSWLGVRQDVPSILDQCDIGVLSSTSEGLPISILEYGMAGLAVVSSNVGQSGEVLEEGQCGILVPPGMPELLASGICRLLLDGVLRNHLGKRLKNRILSEYSADAAIHRLQSVYRSILGS